MPLKVILMIAGTALIVTAGYFFSLYALHGFSPDFLAINKCVESGGRWNAVQRRCENVPFRNDVQPSGELFNQ